MPEINHDPDCLFCKIASKTIPSKTAYEDDNYYAFHDINPAAPTHILIIPRTHIATVNDITPGHESVAGGLFGVARRLAAEHGLSEPGYRVVMNCNTHGGQTVFHIHMHLLGGRQFKWPPG